jgi:predicted lipoprotein with Yx(FWY)xxD motif
VKIRLWRVLVIAVALATAAIGGTGSLAAARPSPATHPGDNPPPGAVVVSAATTAFGRVLVSGNGHALYSFSGDAFPFSPTSPIQLPCTALNKSPSGTPCTTPWPPLLATGPLVGEEGVHQAGLGTVTRNGVDQVTYDGQPLYGFIGDTAAGQVNGANVAAFDGIFWLMSADGQAAPGVATVNTEVSPNGIVLSTPTAHGTERSLYELTYDPVGQTTCLSSTGCTAIWPPLLTDKAPVAGPGVDPSMLGVLRRPDGNLQVTYDGHPVYMFAFDLGPGAPAGLTNGEDFADAMADGVWYTVSPSGAPDPGTATVTSESVNGQSILSVVSAFTDAEVTLYVFSADTATTSACTADCARFWPPVLTSTRPVASGSVNGAELGVIQRSDGAFQVTYDGHPLYFFSHDLTGGTSGAGITAFGGTFQVLGSDGTVG